MTILIESNASNSVSLEWKNINEVEVLFFRFNGKLTKDNAIVAIAEWEKIFDLLPNQKIILAWDCLNLQDYDPMARVLWQNAIKKMRNQVKLVYLITESRIISLGGKMMNLITPFSMIVIKSEEEIYLQLAM